MIRPVLLLARIAKLEIMLTLTHTVEISLSSRSIFVRIGTREVHLQFASGLPRWEFAKESHGHLGLELWGLGMYAAVSRVR